MAHLPESSGNGSGSAFENRDVTKEAYELLDGEVKDTEENRTMSLWEQTGLLVRSDMFDQTIIFLIALNAISLGIETYISQDSVRLRYYFNLVDVIFLVIFTLELMVQVSYWGFRDFLSDPWMVFDFSVVSLSWLFSHMQIIRAFRVFRAVRIFGRVGSLRKIIVSVKLVLPKIASITLIMLLVFYIFAVMFTNLFRNAYADGYCTSDYWGSLDKTLLTMYQLMTLDSWSMITRETMEAYTWSWFPIIIYVTLTAYLVLNLIIAALVDSMMEATKDEQNAFAIENSIIMSNDMSGLRQSIDQLTSQQQLIVDALSLLKNPHFQKH